MIRFASTSVSFRTAGLLLPALIGLAVGSGGAQSGETTPESRSGALRGCEADYFGDADVSIAYVMVGSERVAFTMMPGDGWVGACPGEGGTLMESERESARSADSVMVTLDTSMHDPVDVDTYGHQIASGMRARHEANGFSVFHESAEAYNAEIFAHFLGLEKDGERVMQIHIQRLVPIPEGLLVIHYLLVSNDEAHLENVGAMMINAAEHSEVSHISELDES